jgi:hypothetical protein
MWRQFFSTISGITKQEVFQSIKFYDVATIGDAAKYLEPRVPAVLSRATDGTSHLLGSACVFSNQTLVVTCSTVVKDVKNLFVRFGTTDYGCNVVESNDEDDLAVLNFGTATVQTHEMEYLKSTGNGGKGDISFCARYASGGFQVTKSIISQPHY